MSASARTRGELAIVLHTHMPYVEGFGTWPFGEEWLWEAIASSYLPLLDVLGRAPITLSLTPVLCDQLEAPGTIERCLAFLREIRPESHRLDIAAIRGSGDGPLIAELERSAVEYAAAADRLEALPGGVLGALAAHVSWTSAATHAVLPLLASDAGAALQVQTGVASHRRRFGEWAGGFWLPECAHAPWLHQTLEEAGVRCTCVELTASLGLGDPRHLRAIETDDGPVLWLLDRATVSLIWSERGYPSSGAYRDYHNQTPHDHRIWRNDGEPYDPAAAQAQVEHDARDFVLRVVERVADGGVCVCALDTELLGHWWYEGAQWLGAVVDEAARQSLALTTLDDALERHEPVSAGPELELAATSWGEGGDLRTWSGPGVADLAWRARTAELRALASGPKPGERALRELLALQSSDWAFLAASGIAGDYPRERADGHAQALALALDGDPELEPALRNLAPELAGWVD
ncbi:MAG TPA: 1,4-alpha-glucan branching protein domain-containing protein [Solirubrobacteraceae bacterium]